MTRKRRYLISAAVFAACVGLALGVVAMLPSPPGVTKANFDRIEKGMTYAEAEEILGEPSFVINIPSSNDKVADWLRDDRSWARVAFTDDVSIWMFWRKSVETFTAKLRRWLHLPK